MRAGAGQAELTWAADVRGAEADGRASADRAAPMEPGVRASHGDTLQAEALLPEVVFSSRELSSVGLLYLPVLKNMASVLQDISLFV